MYPSLLWCVILFCQADFQAFTIIEWSAFVQKCCYYRKTTDNKKDSQGIIITEPKMKATKKKQRLHKRKRDRKKMYCREVIYSVVLLKQDFLIGKNQLLQCLYVRAKVERARKICKIYGQYNFWKVFRRKTTRQRNFN